MNTASDDAPPHSIEAEQAILGSYMVRPDKLDDAASAVLPAQFYSDRHRVIYETVRALHDAGKAPDVVTVAERLEAAGTLDDCGGWAYLLQLPALVPHAEHAPHYAAIVREKSDRRALVRQAREVARIAADTSSDVAKAIAELEEVRQAAVAPPVRLIGSAAFDDADLSVVPLIEGFAMSAKPSIAGGPAKGCKTLVETAVVIHGATGLPVFGHERFPVPAPFRSAFFSMESGGATVRANARSICHSLGVRLSDLDGMVFWQLDSLRLSDPTTLTALRREIERKELRYVAVDPLYLALDLDADDDKSVYRMGARLREVSKVVDDTGCSIRLLHHGIKRPQEPYRPMKLVDLSGAGVTEWPGQWCLLSRRSEYDEERPGHHELWLRVGGRDFPGSLVALDIEEFSDFGEQREWRVEVRPASEVAAEIVKTDETRKHARKEAEREAANGAAIERWTPKVVRYLDKPANRAGLSPSAIRDGVGCSGKAWTATFQHLTDTGRLLPCSYVGDNGRTYRGFQLAEHQTAPAPPSEKPDSTGLSGCYPAESGCTERDSTQTDFPPIGGNPAVCVSARPKRAQSRSARGKKAGAA